MSEKISSSNARPVRNCRKRSVKSLVSKSSKSKEKESQVKAILKKEPADRTTEEKKIISRSKKILDTLQKRKDLREINRQKSLEVEDSAEDLERKVAELAQAIDSANHLVVYTGAGISTAASIPDYRGPNGVWTLLQKGQGSSLRNSSLVDAEPTLTHMALARLVLEEKVKHIVSQNCDGLHLRSGVPPDRLSELHGNMYIEVCTECDPEREFVRLFDVTEQTSLRRHKTGRACPRCGEGLRDSIVHFGEKGVVDKPLNWAGAVDAVEEADTILCLGSSLKVLRRYPCLWSTDRPKKQRPQLYIANLQWTPKDSQARLKVNGRCDDIMALVMKQLGLQIPTYAKDNDPIFKMATLLQPDEEQSFSTKCLSLSTADIKPEQFNTYSNIVETAAYLGKATQSEEDEKGEKDGGGNGEIKEEGFVETLQTTCDRNEEAIMPGWFGKGCRKKVVKRVGKRRRSRVTSVESVS